MKDFKSIVVTKGEKSLDIENPTTYPLIGYGIQGAVSGFLSCTSQSAGSGNLSRMDRAARLKFTN